MSPTEDALVGADISRTLVVDDSRAVRESWAEVVEDADLEPVLLDGPFRSQRELLESVHTKNVQAVLCDFDLRSSNWAPAYGAKFVHEWNQMGIPAVLCTRYETQHLLEMRKWRDRIPVLLTPTELSPETLRSGIAEALAEIRGIYSPERRPWRTLVVCERVSERRFYVRVPASHFPEREVVVLPSTVPMAVRDWLRRGGRFLHAHVNIGASRPQDFYFGQWETNS